MRNIYLAGLMAGLGIVSGAAGADIFGWTDDSGVRHFSNFAPPEGVAVVAKTNELPYNGPSEAEIREAERIESLAAARRELAAKEAELLLQQQVAERKIEEANRTASQAIQAAEELISEAREALNRPARKTVVYYGYAPIVRHHRKYIHKRPRHDKRGSISHLPPHIGKPSTTLPVARSPASDRGRFGRQPPGGHFPPGRPFR